MATTTQPQALAKVNDYLREGIRQLATQHGYALTSDTNGNTYVNGDPLSKFFRVSPFGKTRIQVMIGPRVGGNRIRWNMHDRIPANLLESVWHRIQGHASMPTAAILDAAENNVNHAPTAATAVATVPIGTNGDRLTIFDNGGVVATLCNLTTVQLAELLRVVEGWRN